MSDVKMKQVGDSKWVFDRKPERTELQRAYQRIAQLKEELAGLREGAKAGLIAELERSWEIAKERDKLAPFEELSEDDATGKEVPGEGTAPPWIPTTQPPVPQSVLPPERRTVLVWITGCALPFCGYLRYSGGDGNSPFWVVYHGNSDRGSDVIAWCDCLPSKGPDEVTTGVYESGMERPADE